MCSICYGWAETTLWPEGIIFNLQLQSCKHKFQYHLNEFFRGCSVQCVQAYLGYEQFKADMLMKSRQKVEHTVSKDILEPLSPEALVVLTMEIPGMFL